MKDDYYPRGENKGADQLRGYCTADLHLCYRICKSFVFSCEGLIISNTCYLNLTCMISILFRIEERQHRDERLYRQAGRQVYVTLS